MTGQGAPGDRETDATGSERRPYFALVIGSGFGGAVTACRLAQARAVQVADPASDQLPIALLERGRRYAREDFPRLRLPDYLTADPERLTSKRVPDLARLFWTHDQGLWELRNLGELRVAQAAGLGGGSLIYANVHLRPPASVFRSWPDRCDDHCACAAAADGHDQPQDGDRPGPPAYSRTGLRPYYDLVADMLDVEPLPLEARTRYGKTAAMARVAQSLGGADERFLHPPLAVRFAGSAEPLAGGRNRFGREQGDCNGCGNCSIGCQEGAKNTLDLNYLALAEDLGVEVRTLCEVQRIATRGELVEVQLIDHLHPGLEPTLFARHVFLCAGAVGSTEILLRSRATQQRGDPPLGGARLGHAFYANGDNLAAVFDARERLDAREGPTVTTTMIHTSAAAGDGADPPWFLVQDGGLPPSLAEGLGLFRSPLWLARNRFRPADFQRPPPRPSDPPPLAGRPFRGSPATALARGLRQFVPRSLDPLLDRLRAADGWAARELDTLNQRVLDRLDLGARSRPLARLLGFLRPLFASSDKVQRAVGEALAEQYPIAGELFGRKHPVEIALSVGRRLLFAARPSPHDGLLLVMGPDQQGRLTYHHGYLRIRWKKVANTPLYSLQERLLRDVAALVGGELRTNPDWTLGRTPLTAHAQGGCGISARPDGVTRPCGQLWSSDRVYVLDAAAFPGSVGVNPSATIAAVAERNVELFIRRTLGLQPAAYRDRVPARAPERQSARARAIVSFDQLLPAELPPPRPGVPRSRPVGLTWQEEIGGHVSTDPVTGPRAFAAFSQPPRSARPQLDVQPFLTAERRGPVAGLQVDARLDVTLPDLDQFLFERRPRMQVQGSVAILRHQASGGGRRDRHPVSGALYFELRADAQPGTSRLWAQDRKLVAMTYDLEIDMGSRSVPLLGRKLIVDDPGLDLWNDLSTVFVVCRRTRWWVGVMRVQLSSFLQNQLRNMRVVGDGEPGTLPLDEVARGWAFLRFASFFAGNLKNVYSQWL